ncbi:MAG: M1 family metallopeptidase, partial [Opitutaceae bacterium]
AAPNAKFQQLDHLLPTPTAQRTASGAPGHAYWQNRADYEIDATLDDERRHLTGQATITYHNRSPDALSYLWLQLDQNYHAHNAESRAVPNSRRGPDLQRLSYRALDRLLYLEDYDGTLRLSYVTDAAGRPLSHTVVQTMARVDLPEPLAPGGSVTFRVAWDFPINDMKRSNERTGYEQFEADGHRTYTIAQWFPRLAPYTDYTGWQHKQFLGTGEFSLEFGDYTVRLNVPADHVVGATGVLQNPDEVLTPAQRERLREAESAFDRPRFIVTPDEAKAAARPGAGSAARKTWVFRAENVLDFAFASSRRFIWDAMAVAGATHPPTPARADGSADRMYRPPVMAMSLYPPEGQPLWDRYSTPAIAHAIQVFSRYTFAYPYPVAWSVLAGFSGGMEYPMICFNGPRPEPDGTYSRRTKYALIGVVIHEVGHNWLFFPKKRRRPSSINISAGGTRSAIDRRLRSMNRSRAQFRTVRLLFIKQELIQFLSTVKSFC